jgi:hypothetical protein
MFPVFLLRLLLVLGRCVSASVLAIALRSRGATFGFLSAWTARLSSTFLSWSHFERNSPCCLVIPAFVSV